MSLATNYIPAEVEEKWYKYWMDNNLSSDSPGPPSHPPALRPEGLDSTWRRPLSNSHHTLLRGLLIDCPMAEHNL